MGSWSLAVIRGMCPYLLVLDYERYVVISRQEDMDRSASG
jgi:hypothetical protein